MFLEGFVFPLFCYQNQMCSTGSITPENKGGGSDPLWKISITKPLFFWWLPLGVEKFLKTRTNPNDRHIPLDLRHLRNFYKGKSLFSFLGHMNRVTVSHLGGVRQTARHRRCFNELWKFTKFCAQNSWELNERTRAFRENWIQSFFFALIFYCNYEVIFMYLYLWYMLSIITFYIENCTFLYYFIQY